MRNSATYLCNKAKMIATVGDSGMQRFLALMALVGFFAGMSRAILGRNDQTRWYDVLAAAAISAIVSSGIGAAGLYYWGPDRILLIFPLCGVGGWMGIVLMDIAGGFALRLIAEKLPRVDERPPLPPSAKETQR